MHQAVPQHSGLCTHKHTPPSSYGLTAAASCKKHPEFHHKQIFLKESQVQACVPSPPSLLPSSQQAQCPLAFFSELPIEFTYCSTVFVHKNTNYPKNGQCRNPGCFYDNCVGISAPLSCMLMSAGDGTASSVCLQASGPSAVSFYPSLCITEPSHSSGHRGAEVLDLGPCVNQMIWPCQQKQLQIEVQIAFARKSSQDDLAS